MNVSQHVIRKKNTYFLLAPEKPLKKRAEYRSVSNAADPEHCLLTVTDTKKIPSCAWNLIFHLAIHF